MKSETGISRLRDIMLLQECIKARLRDPRYAAGFFYVSLTECNQVLEVMLLCLNIGHLPEILNLWQSPP